MKREPQPKSPGIKVQLGAVRGQERELLWWDSCPGPLPRGSSVVPSEGMSWAFGLGKDSRPPE